jgi:uncharacterized membrane protein
MKAAVRDGASAVGDPSDNTAGCPAIEFSFRITPHRSMSDRAFVYVIAVILTAAFAAQLYFFLIGVWVAGVVALFDGVFLAAAFIACRADRKRVETISLRAGIISVVRRRGSGETIFAEDIPAFGLEIQQTNDPDFGCRRLLLHHRSGVTEVGVELSPSERASFVQALGEALAEHGCGQRFSESRPLSDEARAAQ